MNAAHVKHHFISITLPKFYGRAVEHISVCCEKSGLCFICGDLSLHPGSGPVVRGSMWKTPQPSSFWKS